MIVNISYTNSFISSKFADFLKPSGISIQQFNVLRILRGQHPGPATVNMIIDRMVDKMSNASRLVEKLRHKGLLTRTVCANDRRQVDIYITQEGLKLLESLDKRWSEFESHFQHIAVKEAEQLNQLLDKLRSGKIQNN